MNASMKLGLSTVALLVAGGLAAYAPDASAQVGPLKNTGNSRCLTVTSTGAAITQPCNGSGIQAWSQGSTAAGYLLKNVATGRCLDRNAAGTVFTSACNSGVRSQLWIRLNTAATTARFRSSVDGLMLNSTAAGAINLVPGAANPLQIWAY